MALEIGDTCGKYVVEGLLGHGAMAVVYRVRHRDLGSTHALKVLHLHDDVMRERFRREGMVQSQLRHPNIVAVTDSIEVEGGHGLVMELVDGPSLDRLLAARRPTLQQCDQIARGILAGVGAAHAFGLVHRDLKPANILLQLTPTGPVPKVADFGVAKILGPGARKQTRAGTGLGTPAYVAPEQMRDASKVDPRADLFSLGAILYELVTGRMAFEGADLLEVLKLVSTGRYRDPRELEPHLPDRMVEAIAVALRPKPEERPPDVAALAAIWAAGTAEPVAPWDADAIAHLRAMSERLPTTVSTERPIGIVTTAIRPRAGGRAWLWALAAVLVLAVVGGAGVLIVLTGALGVVALSW